MAKLSLCVIFGGASSEHEVSCVSAGSVLRHLSKEKYDIHTLGITRSGRWLYYEGDIEKIPTGDWESGKVTPCSVLPDSELHGLAIFSEPVKMIPLDAAFPVLHGKNGEDGTIQGLFELAGIPYVGCGVYASSAGMDKAFTKLVVEKIGVKQAKYVTFRNFEYKKEGEALLESAEKELGYPIFVKPASAGSSVGISKAKNRQELKTAVELAFEHDFKAVLEEAIVGRELETAVLGNTDVQVACVGEVLAADEFYTYDAKYNNKASETVIPAQNMPEGKADEIREAARKIFMALDGRGLSRVDFFLREKDHAVIFNEINTLPGFTGISMYPKLFDAVGVDYRELVEKLVDLALEEHRNMRKQNG